MAANKEKVKKRHRKVREAFKKMTDEKKYKYQFIIDTLAERFFYQPKMIEEIICKKEEDDNQPNLFT